MMASIGLIAGFTATISASLTAEKPTGKVRGRHEYRPGIKEPRSEMPYK
jgi:hypothetical protein